MKIFDKKDRLILDVEVDDNSYRNRAIMGDHSLTLYYSLPQHVEIPVGAYCVYDDETYTLMRPEQLKMKHSRLYEYAVVLSSEQEKAKIWKFRNTVDGRLQFPLTATPEEHLRMFVDNMNRNDTGWEIGECIKDVEKLISYDHDYCWDALSKMASEFKTEFEIIGKKVSLKKVEYDKNTPLPLAYGRGQGFKPGVGRGNTGDSLPVEVLYVQGGDTNIDRSKYPDPEKEEGLRAVSNGRLLLPAGQVIAYDGEHFEDEDDFNPAKARHYKVDNLGLSIRNTDKSPASMAEDSLDCSEYYPKRVGTISKVVAVSGKDTTLYDIVDKDIPDNLNYEDYLIGEENMTIIFQSGMLAGKEFEVKYCHESKQGKDPKRFEIVQQEIDGEIMPGTCFVPSEGNTYAVFNVMLPPSYIRDDESKSGASWDMFRAAVKYLFDNEQQKFTFTGELDGIWAKKNWVNKGAKIRLGGYVDFTNDQFAPDGALVRIVNIKDYINNPHSPKIELSNDTVTSGVASTLKELASTEVIIGENHRTALQYTKRRFRDAKETINMIENALSDGFSDRINPIAVETMAMLVGDERLQFQFVQAPGNPTPAADRIQFNTSTKQLIAGGGTIQHMTLDIDSIRPQHAPKEYHYWNVEPFTSAKLDDPNAKYYLYIRAQKEYVGDAGSAEFLLDTNVHKLDGASDYWLLVGILNSESDGDRSFATLYGFTEILPGRITADELLSSDGESYFSMKNSALKLKDKLQFNTDGHGELRVKGVIVQSQNGTDEAPLGCFRGEYNSTATYCNGDEVTYCPDSSSPKSTYRCCSPTPITGVLPTNAAKWQVIAAGVAGKDGTNYSDNLYLNSAYEKGSEEWMLWRGQAQIPNGVLIAVSSASDQIVSNRKIEVKAGEKFTLSGWIKADQRLSLNYNYLLYAEGGNYKIPDSAFITDNDVTTGYKFFIMQFTAPRDGLASPGFGYLGVEEASIWLKQLKWERGFNNNPVWTPAASDMVGRDGKAGPAPVYRGVFDSRATYYGNEYRVDVVKDPDNDMWYVARIDAGTFSNCPPSQYKSKWNTFGANFESVATILLLAENANIANLIFRNQRLESEAKDANNNPCFYLDGLKNEASFNFGNVFFGEQFSKVGWLNVVGQSLIGYDPDRLDSAGNPIERLEITPNELPDWNVKQETEAVKPFGLTYQFNSSPDLGITDATIDASGIRSTIGGVFKNTPSLSYSFTFKVKTEIPNVILYMDNNELAGQIYSEGSQYVDDPYYMPRPTVTVKRGNTKIGEFKLTKDSGQIVIKEPDTYTIEVNVSVAQATEEWNGKITCNIRNIAITKPISKTFIGRDGIMFVYNANYIRIHAKDGIITNINK